MAVHLNAETQSQDEEGVLGGHAEPWAEAGSPTEPGWEAVQTQAPRKSTLRAGPEGVQEWHVTVLGM